MLRYVERICDRCGVPFQKIATSKRTACFDCVLPKGKRRR